MILSTKFIATRASHYSANDSEFCKVTMIVKCDSKEFYKIKRIRNPIGDITAITASDRFMLGINGIGSYAPAGYNQRYPRASKGIIEIKLDYFINKSHCVKLGIDIRRYYFNIELDPHMANVTKVDFVKKVRVS